MTMNEEESKTPMMLGKALHDARMRASLTIEDVAEQLHLSAQIIRDIEDNLDETIASDKYSVTYLRGYIANYAKLIRLDNLNSFSEFQQFSAIKEHPNNLQPSVNISIPIKKNDAVRLWGGLLLIIIVAGFIATQLIFKDGSAIELNKAVINHEHQTEMTGNTYKLDINKE